MTQAIDVALVGATGAVGEIMLRVLEQHAFPVRTLYPLASARSAGRTVRFRGQDLPVGVLDDFDFSRVRIGLFSAGGSQARGHSPPAPPAGCRRRVGNARCCR